MLAGTALPDWIAAADRKSRLRRERIGDSRDPVALGILRHWEDDSWFHATEAFQRTSDELTRLLRAAHPDDPTFRAWFLGHVLVEMLVDRFLIRDDPGLLHAYYDALDSIDVDELRETIVPWVTRPPRRLERYVALFLETRYLQSYDRDDTLGDRLSGLARRVGLPPISLAVRERIPAAARIVEPRVADLMRTPCSPPA